MLCVGEHVCLLNNKGEAIPNLVEPLSLVLMFNNLGQTILEYLLAVQWPPLSQDFLLKILFCLKSHLPGSISPTFIWPLNGRLIGVLIDWFSFSDKGKPQDISHMCKSENPLTEPNNSFEKCRSHRCIECVLKIEIEGSNPWRFCCVQDHHTSAPGRVLWNWELKCSSVGALCAGQSVDLKKH